MKFNFRSLFVIILLVFLILSGCDNLNDHKSDSSNDNLKDNVLENNTNKSKSLDDLFFEILKTNDDGREYFEKQNNIIITNKTKIYPNEFEKYKNLTKFKDLYVNLPDKELYYVKFGSDSSLSLITILDVENKRVVKIFGVKILKTKVQ